MLEDYRLSHLGTDAVSRYERTYSDGFYRVQWEDIERPLLQSTFETLRQAGCRSILDFACGTGRILGEARNYFEDVNGVDISQDMLAIARNRYPECSYYHADITAAPLNRRFDVVSAFRFFLNAQPSLRTEVLKSLHSLLRPGGYLVANIHCNAASPVGISNRLRNWKSGTAVANVLGYREFEETLSDWGYRVEKVIWYSFWPRTGKYLKRATPRLMKPAEQFARFLPIVPKSLAQCYMVVARRM